MGRRTSDVERVDESSAVNTGEHAIVATWSRDWPNALPRRSSEAQRALEQSARDAVVALQQSARRMQRDDRAHRALHARELYTSSHAQFAIAPFVPESIALGPLLPGTTWQASIRLSNAFPLMRADSVPDQRGLALRITSGSHTLDLLATTGEAHAARDGEAMVALLRASAASMRGGATGKLAAVAHLMRTLGLRDGLQLARTVAQSAEAGRPLSALSFYSRAPFQLGPFAVRYRFRATSSGNAVVAAGTQLSDDLEQQLATEPVSWRFELQGFIDEHRTPMDDHRIRWDSPWVGVAALTLPTISASTGRDAVPSSPERGVPASFDVSSTWHDDRGVVFYPLGDLNALRAAAYEASRKERT